MKKAVLMLALIVALALPVFAQEFPDVPSDHWAYQAVNELLNAGIVIGYPDGTYGGKRAMTRYEFAEAIARAIPYIEQKVKEGMPGATAAAAPDLSNYVTKDQIANFVTKDQLAALQKLVDVCDNNCIENLLICHFKILANHYLLFSSTPQVLRTT